MKNNIDENHKVIQAPEEPFDLIDGATGQISDVVKEIEELYKVAKNKENTLDERLEAYEDIIDSEVGDTSLWRARNIEREIGLRQIFLKFEGSNPSGTQKDRIAFAQAMDALRRGFDTITVATCGNYGVAIALAASFAGLRCVIYLPETYHTKRIKEMTDLNAEIIRVPGDYEAAVDFSQQQAQLLEYYDANPGGVNTGLQLTAYGTIASEVYDELRDAPRVVALPVSNGSTLAGVFKGFLSLYRRGKTSKLPKMVGGSSYKKNPVIQAFLNNYKSCIDLRPEKIHETKINEPLINWHSIDGDLALGAIRTSSGWATNASDKKMVAFAKMIREKEGMNVLPASTAGLIALIDQHQKEQLPNDRYVIVLTGKKS
jgi:threonine synthase